jgi:nicotinamidase-related amidase
MIDRATDILGLVDVQATFMPGGELAVAQGDAVVPVINRLLTRFDHAFATQDWHPPGHSSFASAHPGRRPYDTITMPYGQQVLWPDHAIPNAALHRDLDLTRVEVIIRKGFHRDIATATRRSSRTTAAQRQASTAGCASAGSAASSWRDWPRISVSPGQPRTQCGGATRW